MADCPICRNGHVPSTLEWFGNNLLYTSRLMSPDNKINIAPQNVSRGITPVLASVCLIGSFYHPFLGWLDIFYPLFLPELHLFHPYFRWIVNLSPKFVDFGSSDTLFSLNFIIVYPSFQFVYFSHRAESTAMYNFD